MHGRCTCGEVEFEVTAAPMIVHCCHCTWCQRETGSAFALNAYVEREAVKLTKGTPERVETPSNSGHGQSVLRCPSCKVALWSHYAGSGEEIAFLRCGTLEERAQIVPDVHIFTSTKLPWVVLPEGAQVFEGFYRPKEVWPEESLARFKAARAKG
ncbi:GFA family protein [Celeribacter sp.]|uniref:GFA family protein n=1 Tax=Celeribacter sp. TaxID=1890673 RepID=UPI003A8D628C